MRFQKIDFQKVAERGSTVSNPSAQARHVGYRGLIDRQDVMFSFIMVPACDRRGRELTGLPKVAWIYHVKSPLLDKLPKHHVEVSRQVLVATGMCLLNFIYLEVENREEGEKLSRQIIQTLVVGAPADLCDTILNVHERLLQNPKEAALISNVVPIR